MFKRLKEKWNIKSNFQLIIVLIIFSVTGSTSVIVKKAVFGWIGITSDTSLWFKIPLYILVIIPVYQILLLIVGTLFGQFRFAWEFEKKMFSYFLPKKQNP